MWEEYNSGDLLWLGDWGPGWIVALIVMGALVIGVSAYDLRGLRTSRRVTLVTLRGLVYLVAVAMLLEPAIDLKNVSRVKNHVAVLVDRSASMDLKVEDGALTRMARIQEELPALKTLEERSEQDHVFHYFSLGGADEQLAAASLDELTSTRPDGPTSNLSAALEQVQARFADRELGGVILYSDGIDSGTLGHRTRRGEALDSESIELLESLRAPVNTIAAANLDGLKDLAITRVLRDDFAFVHNKVSVEVEIQAIGLGERLLPVTLAREGEALQTREVQITQDETSYRVQFEFVPRRIGQEIYTVEIPALEQEALVENNRSVFLLQIIRDKVRVLQVVGRPSWDERFMRRLLKRDPNVELISFFILRTNESLHNASTDELSLIPFPTRELFENELGSFDMVIFQNFNFGPYNMRQYLPRIEEFVKEGGGFVMVGGELSFASGGYDRTAIEDLLPVQLPVSSSTLIDERRFRPTLTAAGQRHPITQLAFDPIANQKLWQSLPEQYGTNIVRAAKKGATVLATHPNLKANAEPMPVITIGTHGKGRVMAMTTDSSWRWSFETLRDGGTPREYQLFWHNAIRWLIKDPELKLVKLELTEDTAAPGERVELSVRVSNPDYSPAQNREGELVLLEKPIPYLLDATSSNETAPPQATKLPFKTNSAGVATVSFIPKTQGVYRLEAVVAQPGETEGSTETITDERSLLVISNSREFQDILPREELLQKIADATEATFSSLSDGSAASAPKLLEPRTVKINRRRVIQLWDSALTFLLIIVLLGIEWTLRRRWGRL